ncbi:MAG: site-specific integrase [Propioniciclava sp.]|nr:site-specific integrase [Propioniciclava sp.]
MTGTPASAPQITPSQNPERPAPEPAPGPARRPRRRSRRAGFGTVRRLASGRYQVRYQEADGTRRAAPVTFPTRTEAEQWLATVRADQLRGRYHSPTAGQQTLAAYAAEQIALRVELSPSTQELYRTMLRLWIAADLAHPVSGRPLNIGALQLRQLSPTVIAEWHAAALNRARQRAQERAAAADRHRRARALHAARIWARENGLDVARTGRLSPAVLDAWRASGAPAAATYDMPPTEPPRDAGRVQVVQAYRVLRMILNNAHRDGLIPANPCTLRAAGIVKPRERIPATLDELDVIADRMPERFAAAVHVAAWSGLRAGELFALSRSHVNLHTGTLRVERTLLELDGQPLRFGPPKTTASLRTVHLPAPIVDLLTDHMARYTRPGPDALVFADPDGRPLSRARRTAMFRAACTYAGRHDLRWHDLRHTGATMAAQAGATLRELQARLGHSTIAAAMTYQHPTAERDRLLAARMAELMTPSEPPRLRLLDKDGPTDQQRARAH